MRNTIFFVTTALIFSVLGALIWQRELNRRYGKVVYLRLAPVDPRSLMQGDYMVIRYRVLDEAWRAKCHEKGKAMILGLDQKKQGRFMRCAKQDEVVEGDSLLLSFQTYPMEIKIGAESFFFQEGRGKTYEKAVYGKLIVNPQGKAMLLDLVDEKLQSFYPDSAQKHQAQKKPIAPRKEPIASRKEPIAPRKEPIAPRKEPIEPTSQPVLPTSQRASPTTRANTPTPP
jgi:uncharacterized membrane-anchored protein